ncbi:MAG: hypothetical protein FWD64_01935 [Acidobacteriaceae bacterium]|nr:hypothetical protein [Acidobacteriaceae bacterium]
MPQSAQSVPAQDIATLKTQAIAGDAEAQLNLGLAYFNGDGVQKDLTQAVYWIRKAAVQRNAQAQYNLAEMYADGVGVPQDLVLMKLWASRAFIPRKQFSAQSPAQSVEPTGTAPVTTGQATGTKPSLWNVDTPLYSFTYSYPAAAGSIPALNAMLDKDAAGQLANIAALSSDESRAIPAKEVQYESHTKVLIVTDLPAWLSLSGSIEEFKGGVHNLDSPFSLLWDKAQNRLVEATDLFVSKDALAFAIQKPFCVELNRQRAKKRGSPVDPKSNDAFDACMDPANEVVILGSADHAHFTRIGILMPPYEAGPYAEGDYAITLPVTEAVLSAVRPEYRAAFALGQ